MASEDATALVEALDPGAAIVIEVDGVEILGELRGVEGEGDDRHVVLGIAGAERTYLLSELESAGIASSTEPPALAK